MKAARIELSDEFDQQLVANVHPLGGKNPQPAATTSSLLLQHEVRERGIEVTTYMQWSTK
jgi:hypothetical protein